MVELNKILLRIIIPKYPQYNIYSKIPMSPIGPVIVGSAAEKKGIRVEIIDENNYKGTLSHQRMQKQRKAQFVGFYCGLTSTIPRVYELAKLYKQMKATTIAGGMHVFAETEESLNNNIDFVVLGEGQDTITELIDALINNGDVSQIKGLAYLNTDNTVSKTFRQPLDDLDKMPAADFSLLKNLKTPIKTVPMFKAIGCDFDCEFCSVRGVYGKARSKSSKSVVLEITRHMNNGINSFFIVDDNFVGNREETITFLKELIIYEKRYRKMPSITVQVRADIAKDTELLDLMALAGARNLCIGYESPFIEELKMMKKGVTPEHYINYTKTLKDRGFFIHGMFMFGYPIENAGHSIVPFSQSIKERISAYKAFIRKLKLDSIQVLHTIPLPGSKLYSRLRDVIYSRKFVGWDKYDGQYAVWHRYQENMKGVQDATVKLMRWFYKGPIKSIHLPIYAPFEWVLNTFNSWFGKNKERFHYIGAGSRFKNRISKYFIKSYGAGIIKKWSKKFKEQDFYKAISEASQQLSFSKNVAL